MIEEASLFLTYMDESLLGVWRVRLQDKLDGVCNATLVHSYHRWLEDNLWDPAWKSAVWSHCQAGGTRLGYVYIDTLLIPRPQFSFLTW